MFCSECGHELPNNAKFCSNCGLKQNEERFAKSKDSINQDIEHSNSKKEPKLPSELDYETSYSDLISSGDEVADLPGDALLQKNPAPNDGKAIVFIGGVILSIIILIIFLASITDSSYEVAEVVYDGCWSGAFTNLGGSSISIDGCGFKSFNCTSNYCGILAQKEDDSDRQLCVRVGYGDPTKDDKYACTTAEYGIASV